MSAKIVFSCLLFLFLFSFAVGELTHTNTTLLNPVTLAVTGGLLAVVIGASNTPIVKGVAMLALFLDIAFHFFFSPVDPLILGLIVAPILLTLGLAMAEVGKG